MASASLSRSLNSALRDLRDERSRIDQAIAQLQDFIGSLGSSALQPAKADGRTRRRPRWTEAGRRAAAERMRRYWAQRRKAAGKSSKGRRASVRLPKGTSQS